MKSLTDQEVSHIAKLANLELETKDLEVFSAQLSAILLYVDQLNQVDTQEITPLSSITDSKNVFRQDLVKPSLTQDQALQNSSSCYKGFFKVKAIFS